MSLLFILLSFQIDMQTQNSVVNAFAALTDFEVRFRQESYSDFFEDSVSEGFMRVLRPGKMRMEYLKGDRKTFIWDGTSCYERDHLADTESWTPQEEVKDEPMVQLLLYGSDISKLFIIDRYKDEQRTIYRFRPRDNNDYHLEVVFDQEWRPSYVEVIGDDGEGSRFIFTDYKLKPKSQKNEFQVPKQQK